MLLDGAIRFSEQARAGLEEKNFERAYEGITRTQAILLELLNGLDPRHGDELCKRLSGLYTYMYTRLVAANSLRDVTIVEEVCKLLGYERETWVMLMDKLADENGQPGAATDSPAEAVPFSSSQDTREHTGTTSGTRLSVQG